MTYIEKLISLHVVERETNKNFLTWTYPSIPDDHKNFVLNNCFTVHNQEGYVCLRKQKTWFHIDQVITTDKQFAIVLLANEFEPNKYKLLCHILGKKYSKSKNPVELVRLYLNLLTSGSCSLQENGTHFCDFKNYRSSSNIKDFIQLYDLEIVLFYTAILLKRRVICYNTNLEQLQKELLAITALVPCRNYSEYLHPLVESGKQLRGLSFFVAGTNSRAFIKEENLYDIFVNMETREFTISPKADETMAMTKTHKDVATFLVKLSSSELAEAEIEKQIMQKTDELLNILKNLASVMGKNNTKMITMSDLKSKKYHPALENFLFNLALAENMMIL